MCYPIIRLSVKKEAFDLYMSGNDNVNVLCMDTGEIWDFQDICIFDLRDGDSLEFMASIVDTNKTKVDLLKHDPDGN